MSIYRDIAIADINAGARLRGLDPVWVNYLAEEIAAEGQIEAIRVVERGDGFELVDGARRLAALLQLGRNTVEAKVEPEEALADDAAIRIAEIKAHLLRGALTALEHGVSIGSWCAIYKDRFGAPKRGRKPKQLGDDELSATLGTNWSEAAQTALGIGRRTLFRALKVASIPVEVRSRILVHPIADKQTELLLLAEQSEAKQTAIVDMLTSDPARAETVGEAMVLLGAAPTTQIAPAYERMSERFARLPEKEQHAFFALHESAIRIWLAQPTSRSLKVA